MRDALALVCEAKEHLNPTLRVHLNGSHDVVSAAGTRCSLKGGVMERSGTRHVLGGLLLATGLALCSGCARARVQNMQRDWSQTPPRPPRVVVFDFDTGAADVRVGSSPRRTARRAVGLYVIEEDTLAKAVADALANRLVEDIRGLGLTAERAAGAAPPGLNDLVIQGQFLRLNEGSQVQRFVIGLGVGATQLRTQ